MTRYSMILLRAEGRRVLPNEGRRVQILPELFPIEHGDRHGDGSSPREEMYNVGVSVVYPCVSQLYLMSQVLEPEP